MITFDPVEAGGYGRFEGVSLSNTASLNNTYGVRVDTTTAGGFARAYRFANLSGSYAVGGFGAYGTGNILNYLYIYASSESLFQTPTTDYVFAQFRFYTDGLLMLNSASPRLDFYETDSAANARRTRFRSDGGIFSALFVNDADTDGTSWLDVTRTGNTAFSINFIGTNLLHNGSALATQSWVGSNYSPLGHTHAWSEITGEPTTLSGYGITDAVPNSRSIQTANSLSGGGLLSSDLTLELDGDQNTPGNNKFYGTNSSGVKGWQSHSWANLTGTPTTLGGYGISDAVPNSLTVGTRYSLTGGGSLSGNLLLNLVNDEETPTASKYYGTDSGGTRGWHPLPSGGGGVGTVTSVSVASANGFGGSVLNPTTTPEITLSTSITGLLKGNGTAISAAVAGTDYATASHNHDGTYVKFTVGATEVQSISGYTYFTGADHRFRAPAAGSSIVYFLGTVSDPTGTAQQIVHRTATQVRSDIGAGTVSSVSLAVPSFLSVSGSPISSVGQFTVTLVNQSANSVFAGPTSGGASVPSFRSLVDADIPAIPISRVTGLTSDLSDKLSKSSGGTVVGSLYVSSEFRSRASQSGSALTYFPGWTSDPTSTEATLRWRTASQFLADIGGVPTTRAVWTTHSIQGGSYLSADRTLSLVGDEASPVSKYYGANASGTRGWYSLTSITPPTTTANAVYVWVVDDPSGSGQWLTLVGAT